MINLSANKTFRYSEPNGAVVCYTVTRAGHIINVHLIRERA